MAYDANHIVSWDAAAPDGAVALPSSLDDAIREIKRCINNDVGWRSRTITSNYTATDTDTVIFANPTTANITVTLPLATGRYKEITVVHIGSPSYSVIVSRSGSDTIDGAVSLTISAQYRGYTLRADGVTAWHKIVAPAEAQAPAFPAGTKMFFYQNTAPTGWSITAGIADCLLAVKGGSGSFNVSGGTLAGTWTQPGHTHTGPSHTHTLSAHTHTLAHTHEMDHHHLGGSHTHTGPSHTHTGPSHTHTITAHTHTLDHTHAFDHHHLGGAHTHTLASHTHTMPHNHNMEHYHIGPAHTHLVNAHTHYMGHKHLVIGGLKSSNGLIFGNGAWSSNPYSPSENGLETLYTGSAAPSTSSDGAAWTTAGYATDYTTLKPNTGDSSATSTGGSGTLTSDSSGTTAYTGSPQNTSHTGAKTSTDAASTSTTSASGAGTTDASGTGVTSASGTGATGSGGNVYTGGAYKTDHTAAKTNTAGASTETTSAAAPTTAASGTDATGSSATAATYRPYAAIGIICSKD